MSKFADFVKKAEKRERGNKAPYKIELEGTVYEIPFPDAVQYLEFSETEDSQILSQLKILFRKAPEAWGALIRELEGEDVSVLYVVIEEMGKFWRLDEQVNPGKSGKSAK